MEKLRDKVLRLPLEQRIQLIEVLFDSFGASEIEAYPLPDRVIDESDRGFEAHMADPRSSVPWAEVRARLRERYPESTE